MIDYPLPVLGFCAFSGTGKTTLLEQLIPLLVAENIRVALIKHAHHNFEIDHPNKDSYKLYHAGASKMLIIAKKRVAIIERFEPNRDEPTLQESVDLLNPNNLDLVLVEGFKTEHFPKIELHRSALNKPLMFPNDPDIIAFSSDKALLDMPKLNKITPIALNEPTQFINFIKRYIASWVQPT